MFESNYNYVPNPYPPAPVQQPGPGGWFPPPPTPPGPPIPPGPPVPPPPVYIDPSLSVPGAAAEASTVGKLLASKIGLDTLTSIIKLVNGALELEGYSEAEQGQVPSKGENGTLDWINPATPDDIENLQQQIVTINSQITGINSNINQLYTTTSQHTQQISDLQQQVSVHNQKIEEIENDIADLQDALQEKLDKETFQAFLETYHEKVASIEGRLDALEESVQELLSCCADVKAVLDKVIGNPDNYEQPVYQTMQDFETHLQAINRNFDGGDLDEELPMALVPDVVGMMASVANLVLGQEGFYTEASMSGESYADNLVVTAQSPAAGEEAPEGSVIELTLEEVSG